MGAIFHLAMKDLRVLVRDKAGLFWVAAFPLLMALFFGSIFGSEGGGARNLKIAVVRDSVSPIGRQFYEQLKKSEVLNVVEMSRDSARTEVIRGRIVAMVEFKGGGKDAFSMFGEGAGSIDVGIDPSRRAEAGYLNGLLNQAYFQLLQGAMTNTSAMREMLRERQITLGSEDTTSAANRTLRNFFRTLDTFMVSLNQVDSLDADSTKKSSGGIMGAKINFEEISVNRLQPRSAFEVTFPQSLQWAMIGCAAAFAISIVIERTRGTFARLRLAPISSLQILAGKGLACFLTSVIMSTMLILIGVIAFKVRIVMPLGIVAAILASSYCFVGLMMLMSVLGKTEASVSGSGWGIFMVFSMTGGGMIPLMMMPGWMKTVSNFSPIKWSVLAAEGAIWRGFGFADMLTPVLILVAIGTVGFSIGVYILQRSDG